MATAADRFLASLTAEQKAKASFPFDSPERLNWHFIPRPRQGLPLKELDGAQRALAFGLLQSGLVRPCRRQDSAPYRPAWHGPSWQ